MSASFAAHPRGIYLSFRRLFLKKLFRVCFALELLEKKHFILEFLRKNKSPNWKTLERMGKKKKRNLK